MNQPVWKKYFWRNTATNYLRTFLRLVTGLILFRMTFQYLTTEEFGFYSLLWSLFGYSILLDFGLGFTAQKAVAEHSSTGDIHVLNRLISTVFWTFSFFGVLLLAVFILIEPWFLNVIKVHPGDLASFSTGYKIFFVFMAFGLPLGLFTEILRGLQRIDIANWILVGSQLINFALLTTGLLLHWPFPWIILISVATSILPGFLALAISRRSIRGLSLHPSHFRFSSIQAVLSFSLVSYTITFTNLIMSRTDQAVISFTIGVAFIAVYQAGFKVADMFNLLSLQMQDALSPAAAHLNAQSESHAIRDLLIKSSSLTALLTIPLYFISAAYLEPCIRILTGLKEVDHQTYWVGQALLLSSFSSIMTSSCSKRIMMMCGWEKSLLKASIVDALLNLILSLLLVFSLGVLGVALGTMIPTILIGWMVIVPMSSRFIQMPPLKMLTSFIAPVWKPVAVSLTILALLLVLAPMSPEESPWGCVWRGALAGLPVLILGRHQLRKL